MTSAAFALTVDGTLLACKGAIAKLETEFSARPSGTVARVLLNDVPSRIDVRAWADRKGHRVVGEAREGEVFEILIAKGGNSEGGPGSRGMLSRP